MPDGGLLSIATRSEGLIETGRQSVTNDFAILQVSDTGHGISAEVRAHIFEPFFTTKQLGKGTGLGLSTVLGIAERAGGRIEVQSEPGQGTTFKVYLPRVGSVTVPISKVSMVTPPRLGTETILLIEDEPGIRAMTRAYLETQGYMVLEAADGVEAIEMSFGYSGVIDLVLSDILMPGIKGDEAVREIRKQRPEIKALFMSGFTDHEWADKSEPILFKPFEFPDLGRRLRAVFDLNQSRGPIAGAA
jgi:CheY-like chemotaxis protein